ncbi:hypothetical protein ACOMICROBIO_FLGHMIGD_01754 [Vibrio sp. B1FLJ16]|uniref:hypothetical protein n=1 Tax=Vibrio sp. B1FLJ16 TaxID=2751178 RepID=UPI0015F57F4F|nr:hypothetical protein [Vibrio sp. B1FLJ16]CAD7807948.1 hypothetical protein ACOMICROBIO_FLGHMIGD_01754 [Vibrio sp. B1FLJ16]CAE6905869.1 hypothetical protein ACOMICROBIO_FLGHMIGD_01754 [Vibrio sp. B1FLJ16]
MRTTKHGSIRAGQRGLGEDELNVLSSIGQDFYQKGGTLLCTISKKEKIRWLDALKEVLNYLGSSDEIPHGIKKRKQKAIRHLIDKLSAKHPPYLIICEEGNSMITCGYHFSGKIQRN